MPETKVYIDQNVLTEMRDRKLVESSDASLIKMRNLCRDGKLRAIYSSVHLKEIQQIINNEYRDEHISLLSDLGAGYFVQEKGEIIYSDAKIIWEEYTRSEIDNTLSGINESVHWQDLINRKMCGIPVDLSFKELSRKLRASLIRSLKLGIAKIDSMTIEEIEATGKAYVDETRRKLTTELDRARRMKLMGVKSSDKLGPKPFREEYDLHAIESLLPGEVIPKLEGLFKEANPDFDFYKSIEDTLDNRIAVCYSLLNWAGYYADDFTRHKKGKDRFNASSNDLGHVQQARSCDILISNDANFIKKATVIYKHLNIGVIVAGSDYAAANL